MWQNDHPESTAWITGGRAMAMPDLTPYGVKAAPRRELPTKMCHYHPSFVSEGRCTRCKHHFCDQCLVEIDLRREAVVCLDCALTRAGIRQRRR